MKLCTFRTGDATRVGVVTDDGVVDLSSAAPDPPQEMTALLAAGADALVRGLCPRTRAPSSARHQWGESPHSGRGSPARYPNPTAKP
jgi:hypothetical protein